MTKHEETIQRIANAIALWDDKAPIADIKMELNHLDPESIGVLHGITGVLLRAIESGMPDKWFGQIHDNLLEAFESLCELRNENN